MTFRVWKNLMLGPAAALLATLLFACSADQTTGASKIPTGVEDFGNGLYAFRYGSARSIFMVTDEGVIVTDPLNSKAAKLYRAAIAKLTDQPVKYVVYSHLHWDSIAGGQIFKDEGAEFIAQERCAQNFEVNPNPAIVKPDITFSHDYTVTLGGKSLDLAYFGPSNSECLIVMLPRPANILFIADLVNAPTADFPPDPTIPHIKPYNIVEFFQATEKFAADNGVKNIVGSSVKFNKSDDGSLVPQTGLGPVSIVTDQRIFWDSLIKTVLKANDDGFVAYTSFVMADKIDLTPFTKYDGYNEDDLAVIMRRIVSYAATGR